MFFATFLLALVSAHDGHDHGPTNTVSAGSTPVATSAQDGHEGHNHGSTNTVSAGSAPVAISAQDGHEGHNHGSTTSVSAVTNAVLSGELNVNVVGLIAYLPVLFL